MVNGIATLPMNEPTWNSLLEYLKVSTRKIVTPAPVAPHDANEWVDLVVDAYNGGGSPANGAAVTASVEPGSNATFDIVYDGVRDPSKVFVGPDRPAEEFYDLQKDPHELKNQYANPEYKAIIANLETQLTDLRREFKDTDDPLKSGKKRRK